MVSLHRTFLTLPQAEEPLSFFLDLTAHTFAALSHWHCLLWFLLAGLWVFQSKGSISYCSWSLSVELKVTKYLQKGCARWAQFSSVPETTSTCPAARLRLLLFQWKWLGKWKPDQRDSWLQIQWLPCRVGVVVFCVTANLWECFCNFLFHFFKHKPSYQWGAWGPGSLAFCLIIPATLGFGETNLLIICWAHELLEALSRDLRGFSLSSICLRDTECFQIL